MTSLQIKSYEEKPKSLVVVQLTLENFNEIVKWTRALEAHVTQKNDGSGIVSWEVCFHFIRQESVTAWQGSLLAKDRDGLISVIHQKKLDRYWTEVDSGSDEVQTPAAD